MMNLSNESTYRRWCSVVLDRSVSTDEVTEYGLKAVPILFPELKLDLLVNVLEATQEAVWRMLPYSLYCWGNSETQRMRFCPPCLASGYHSVFHQNLGLLKCPVHDHPLTTGCPHCGGDIKPSWVKCVESPFACTRCKKPFFKLAEGVDEEEIRRIDLGLQGLRSWMARRSSYVSQMEIAVIQKGRTWPGMTSLTSRQTRLHGFWPTLTQRRVRFVPAGPVNSEQAVVGSLIEIVRAVPAVARADFLRILGRLHGAPSGLVTDVDCSRIGAAVYKVLLFHRVSLWRLPLNHVDPADENGFAAAIEQQLAGANLIECHWVPCAESVYSLFATTLCFASLWEPGNFDWRLIPDAASWVPAEFAVAAGMFIKYRADLDDVRRLVARFGGIRFEIPSVSLDIQRLRW